MKICISAESTIDLTNDLLNKYQIKTIPFTVLLGENQYRDGELDPTEIFKYVDEKGVLPKTSAVNQFQYEEYFEEILKEYDAIIHFSLSSEFSSSYNNAVNAANEYNKDNRRVYVIDTRSLSTGIALQAIYASTLNQGEADAESIYKQCLKRVPEVQASFVVNTLEYLYKGGRCSTLAVLGSKLLRIKPQICVKDGKMNPGKKYFGKSSHVVEDYCKDTLEEFNTPDLSIGFVTHSHATQDMIDIAVNKMKEAGFKEILVTTAGSTISSHCGPKTLGILYFNKENKKSKKTRK